MLDEPLPADLKQIEQDFGSFMQFDPEAEFPQRIAHAVRNELRRERSAARWKFTLALAGSALLWMNLSFYAASITNFHFRHSRPAMPMARLAEDFQIVLPGFSREEAIRQAKVFQSGADSMRLSQP
jgi:hypothetical protein